MGSPALDRDREIEALGQSLTRARAGHGGLVAIEGPAGIGKTRLLDVARDLAGDEWTVLDARCTPLSEGISWCVPRDWFSPVRGHLTAGAGRLLADLPDAGRPIGDVVYALRLALEELSAEQPLLLVADDLQWADASSLQALDLLVSAVQHLPCLVVYAVRTGESTSAPESLARLLSSSRVLSPGPLSQGSVAALLAEASRGTGAAERIHALTGGNPYLVHEVILDPDHPTPDTVVGSITGRLTRISATAPDTARAAAVLGEHADVPSIATLTGIPQDAVADDVAALVAADLLAPGAAPRSGLLARAMLARVPSAELARLHARAADLLRRKGAPRSEVAGHLLRTLPRGDAEVRRLLAEHGREALASGAHEAAARHLQRAVDEMPLGEADIDLVAALADAYAGQGDIDHAVATWQLAASLTEDASRKAALGAEGVDALLLAGRAREAYVVAGRIAAAGGEATHALAPRRAIAGMLAGLPVARVAAEADRLLAEPTEPHGTSDRLSLAAASLLRIVRGAHSDEARDLALRAVTGGIVPESAGEALAAFLAARALSWTSALAQAESVLTGVVDHARLHRSVDAFATGSACRGRVLLRQGRVREAMQDFEAALSQRDHGWSSHLAMVLSGIVECRLARGEVHAANRLAGDLERLVRGQDAHAAYAVYALAELAGANGHHEQSAALYADLGVVAEGRYDNPAIVAWRAGRALALLRTGQAAEAVELVRENSRRARAFGSPYALSTALRAQAAVDGGVDRVALLREAVELASACGAARLSAQAATDLAGMLVLTAGSAAREEAVRLLRGAEAYAHSQDLVPLSNRAGRLLERLGEEPSLSARATVDRLTASERRVADLAATGLTNREIAEQLFVTVKAVEWHLSNVYRKLGIRSRNRLPAALAVPMPRREAVLAEPPVHRP